MKKQAFIFHLALIALILLVASCGSNRSFSSRKYMAGNYISHKHKLPKVSVHENPVEEATFIDKDEIPGKTGSAAVKVQPIESESELVVSPEEKTESSSANNSDKKKQLNKKEVLKEKTLKGVSLRKYLAGKTERKCLAYDDGGTSLDSMALVSFILGIAGLVLNILALSMIIGTLQYVFALLFIAGMVMGIIAVVFGTQGMRRYHKNKNGAINLVFSIIGTAFGAGAIITAFIFAFYTFILAISGL